MTYTTNTVSELYESVSQVAKYGFNNIVTIADYMDINWTQNHVNTLNHQMSMLMNLKEKYPSLYNGIFDIRTLNARRGDCFGGIVSFAIDVNGDIFPCTFSVGDEELKLGSVFDEDVSEAKQKELVKVYISENEGCEGCLRKELCDSTRCKLLNKKVMGDFNKPIPIMCALQKVNLTTKKKLKDCNVV